MVTFPTGPKWVGLRWHDGFVVEYGKIQDDEGGAGTVHQYSPIDAAGCECTTPFNGKEGPLLVASRTCRIQKRVSTR